VITVAPTKADYNTTFSIRVSGPPPKRVTAVKLGSVTHSLDSNKRFIKFTFEVKGDNATVTVPASRSQPSQTHRFPRLTGPDAFDASCRFYDNF
jgi:hypothetical protein